MKKWRNWWLMAGLVTLISFKEPAGTLKLEKTVLLTDFPSGSSLEFYKNRLYLFGDDASRMLVLDPQYNRVDSLQLFGTSGARIAKITKPDLEASALLNKSADPHLLVLGSASAITRKKAFFVSFKDNIPFKSPDVKTNEFFKRLLKLGVKEVNIEGAVSVNNHLLLANRGNLKNRKNHLVSTSADFLNQQKAASIKVLNLDLNIQTNDFIGISGLAYIPSKDLLLFTASSEDTRSSVADGAIGDSYLGWVTNITGKLNTDRVSANALINLSTADKAFEKQKVESICLEKIENNKMILHLVSDNDNGESRLFKVRVQLD